MRRLAGPFVEIRCRVAVATARERYRRRVRDGRHLDGLRTEDELWRRDVAPLGAGPLVEVDTAQPVDTAAALARTVRSGWAGAAPG